MSVDMSEYLIVLISRGYGEGADHATSIRCNRKETADQVAEMLNQYNGDVKIFHDPPKIGQGAL
jgi:hypothetical protein